MVKKKVPPRKVGYERFFYRLVDSREPTKRLSYVLTSVTVRVNGGRIRGG